MAIAHQTTKEIRLTDVPDDIYKFLLSEQSKTKQSKGLAQFSLAKTVYCLIKCSDSFKDFKKANK